MGAFRLLSLFGEAPEAVPGAAGDALAATGEVDADATVGLGGTEGATIGFGAVVGETFSGAWAVNAGELIGTVCFSNSRATLLSLPRSRAGVGELGVAGLMAVAVGCGSLSALRVEGAVAGGKLAVARGASVGSGGDVGVVVGTAVARGVSAGCGIGVEVSVMRGTDVEGGVAVVIAAAFSSVARTNLFGGASGGGVASDLIFARAWSASR